MFCIALLGWNLTYIFLVTRCVCGIGRGGGASFLNVSLRSFMVTTGNKTEEAGSLPPDAKTSKLDPKL